MFCLLIFLGWHGNGDGGFNNHHNHNTTTSVISADTFRAPALHRGAGESELEFHLRETEQLLEITLLKKKLRETELAMSNIIAKMGTVPKAQVR